MNVCKPLTGKNLLGIVIAGHVSAVEQYKLYCSITSADHIFLNIVICELSEYPLGNVTLYFNHAFPVSKSTEFWL